MVDETSPLSMSETAHPSSRTGLLGQPAPLPVIRGSVIEETTGLPLAGVVVHWVTPGVPGLGKAPQRSGHVIQLGEATTASDGGFEILTSDTPQTRQALCTLAWQKDAVSHFRVGVDKGMLEFPAERADGEAETVIRVAQTVEPSAEQWGALSSYMASNRLIRADDLCRQLSAPFSDSPTNAWSVSLRAGALAAIGHALGNGDSANSEPAENLQLLNFDALAGGDVLKAVTNYRDVATFERFGGRVSEWLDGSFLRLPKSDVELYRDYLRGVWVSAARQMHSEKGAPVPTDAALEAQLGTRFHQDFQTSDVARKSSHALLIPILKAVLTARADREGFGVTVAALPVRAPTQSDADYVATLIARTAKSATELRNRFRVRFDRPLGDETSSVALNVEALLGLLADTYESPEEPFPTLLRGIEAERPLIFPTFLGRAPFFLQYDEWLDRQRRFYPENVYDIRRTLPAYFKEYRDVVLAQKTAGHPKINPNNDFIASETDWHDSAKWVERQFWITDEIRAAMAAADKQGYPDANAHLDAALHHIDDARKAAPASWRRDDFVWVNDKGNLPLPNELKRDRRVSLKSRAARPATTPGELAEFEAYFDTRTQPHVFGFEGGPQDGDYDWMESWLARARTLYVNELDYFQLVLIPYLRSTILMTLSDYAGATKILGRITGFEIGVAELTATPGYQVDNTPLSHPPYFYQRDSLPYTTAVAFDAELHSYADQTPLTGTVGRRAISRTTDRTLRAPIFQTCARRGNARLGRGPVPQRRPVVDLPSARAVQGRAFHAR